MGALLATLIAGVGIVVMTIITPELGRYHYYPGAILVLFYCYMLIRLRFLYASLSGWLIFLSYVFSILAFPVVDTKVAYVNIFFLASANILGMFGGYTLELYLRRDFYYRYLLGQERQKVEQANEILEDKVKEKTQSLEKDIQRRRLVEKELIVAKEKAEESDRLKSAFLANMSHEIRTPMNGILGFAELLSDPDLDGVQQQKYISIIQNSGERMLNTVNNLMDISRIETGLLDPNIEQVNVIQEINNLYNFFKPEVEQKGLQLMLDRKKLPDELIIQTDRAFFESILTNLLKNAIKYTKQGRIRFGLRIQEDWLEFYVSDTGIGIPANRQQAIFERFVQADISDKQVFEGSGLGLAISKAYVEMLGGKISLNSTENEGSIFYFTLPFKGDEKNKQADKHSDSEGKIAFDKNNLNLLVVEDDETALQVLQHILRDKCNNIYTATTGKEAVEFLRNNKTIDLVLMDIKMPEMNGYEATRMIREFNKEVLIIAQTAYALEGDREKALEAGCDDYISKPIKKKILLSLIKRKLS
ncbi:MAG: response regulator [Bacteroidales bacterium]|nr:response regulator [Bacteroidales bacterium]